MSSTPAPVTFDDPVLRVSIIVLGAGGDLTRRLLLPGLGSLLAVEDCEVELIGSSDQQLSDAQWRELIDDSMPPDSPPRVRQRVVHARFHEGDATDPDLLRSLFAACRFTPVVYFALPPSVTMEVCTALQRVDIPDGTRLALEKPFGVDLDAARRLNALLRRLVPEDQVFRIDHFLGKSMVLNILGLRFANRVLEPVWRAEDIERVEVVFDEELALEGRGRYYDHAGALVDMLQSHLLEVLALVAMDPPPRIDYRELRSNVAQVLRNTRLWAGDPVTATRRARYTAGRIGDRELPAYASEPGVDPRRETETLAQITCEVGTPRWRGVPFVLRSGKALGDKRSQVRVRFRPEPLIDGFTGPAPADLVVMDLSNGEVELRLTMNGAGDPFELEQGRLIAQVPPGPMLAYGEVLRAIVNGDPMLSVRDDIAEECWRIVTPAIDAWRAGAVPLEEYAAGSAGPSGWEPPAALG